MNENLLPVISAEGKKKNKNPNQPDVPLTPQKVQANTNLRRSLQKSRVFQVFFPHKALTESCTSSTCFCSLKTIKPDIDYLPAMVD